MTTKFVSLILLAVSPLNGLWGQTLSLGLGVGHTGHYANMNIEKPPPKPMVASIGSFYNNEGNQYAEIGIYSKNLSSGIDVFVLKIGYENHEATTMKKVPTNFVLGDKLGIQSVFACIGYGRNKLINHQKILFQGAVGIVRKWYRGESKVDNNTKMISTYRPSNAFRMEFGLLMHHFVDFPVGLKIQSSYDLGAVKRSTIKFYDNNHYSAYLKPTGDLVLPDNVFYLQLGVQYMLDFRH